MKIEIGTKVMNPRSGIQTRRKELLQNGQSSFQILGRQIMKTNLDNRVNTEIRETSLWHIIRLLFAGRSSSLDDWPGESPGLYWQQPGISEGSMPDMLSGIELLQIFDSDSFRYAGKSRREEAERSSFSVVGTVRTADGRKIQFQISVSMSRVFLEYYKEELQVGNAQLYEPLDIKLDVETAEVSNQKFFFDIGRVVYQDEIYRLGSSYLALDENDPVWSGIQIRCEEEGGQETMYRLVQKNAEGNRCCRLCFFA